MVKPALIGAGKWTLMTATISLETTPVYCRITYPQHSRQVLIYSWKNWAVEACDDFCPIFHQKKRKKQKWCTCVSNQKCVMVMCWWLHPRCLFITYKEDFNVKNEYICIHVHLHACLFYPTTRLPFFSLSLCFTSNKLIIKHHVLQKSEMLYKCFPLC